MSETLTRSENECSLPPGESARSLTLGAGVAAGAIVALYFAFVLHYSVNDIYWDDWSVVPLIHAALHGHLTFSTLWAQYSEERIIVPNLIVVGVGAATHDDTRVTVLLSAVALIAGYLFFLSLLHSYLRRQLTLLPVLSVGLIWFSLADYFNALWAFQFAWYLILFFFVLMLYLLLRESRGSLVFGIALVTAIAASYSSVQGLLLWPVGLMCLLWPLWQLRERRITRTYAELGVWMVAAVVTTAIFLQHYSLRYGQFGAVEVRPPTWAVRHPIELARFFLVDVGNVIPNAGTAVHEIVGLIICVAAGYVVVQSVRLPQSGGQCPLPVAVIAFAILFDLSVASGRLSLGMSYAFKSEYTMPNLLLLVAIVSFAFARLGKERPSLRTPPRAVAIVVLSALAGFTIVQVATSTQYGLKNSNGFKQQFVAGARLSVNLVHIPSSEWGCYEVYGVFPNIHVAKTLQPLLDEARADQLGPFAQGSYRTYRAEGAPPTLLPHCLPVRRVKASR